MTTVGNTMKPGAKALAWDVQRQLRIVVGGLMGSGKSTVCRMLADLLDGTWINQDEFAYKSKNAANAFLAEIKNISKNSKVPVLIVDKINTMHQHREGILDAMESGLAGDVVFVQFAHPLDTPGNFDYQIEECIKRIRKRGLGHRTLMGGNPELEGIVRMTAGGLEPLRDAELARLSGYFVVDMTMPPGRAVTQLLADLYGEGLLGRCNVDGLVSEERVRKAVEAAKSAEAQLSKEGKTKTKGAPVGAQNNKRTAQK